MTDGVYQRRRNLVRRPADGKVVNVARFRGNLFVCADACCCGRTDLGNAPLDTEQYHAEWMERRLRNFVHLTIGGCLGPCALANVNLLLFDGRPLWFHSLNSPEIVTGLFDYIEAMLDAGEYFDPPPPLSDHLFTASTWQPRPDGQELDDQRQWRGRALRPDSTPSCEAGFEPAACESGPEPSAPGDLLATLDDAIAAPRKNGEIVFDAPWQSRAFGVAASMVDAGVFTWDQFRDHLIVAVREAEARPEPFEYYACWLQALETTLGAAGLLSGPDLEERTLEFEFGERFDIS